MAVPLVLAHRGARRVAPENTVEAFEAALRLGADGVELDVHRTLDGELVVRHDADVPDLGVLSDRSLGEIRAALPDIPTLAEALDACAGKVVNIEIKNLPGDSDFDPDEQVAEMVVDLLRARGGGDEVLVSSFNLATIDRVQALDGALPTGFLTMLGFAALDALEVCAEHGHAAYHPFVGTLADDAADAVVERARALDVRLNVWTVNDAPEMQRLAAAGVDGIVTDVPDVAREALRA